MDDESETRVPRTGYENSCRFCDSRLLGFTKQDFIDHLRSHRDDYGAAAERAARVNEEMCVDDRPCVGTESTDSGGNCGGTNQ